MSRACFTYLGLGTPRLPGREFLQSDVFLTCSLLCHSEVTLVGAISHSGRLIQPVATVVGGRAAGGRGKPLGSPPCLRRFLCHPGLGVVPTSSSPARRCLPGGPPVPLSLIRSPALSSPVYAIPFPQIPCDVNLGDLCFSRWP